MKVEYKSIYVGIALGIISVFAVLFLLGDIETEFSFTTGESANKNDMKYLLEITDTGVNN